MKKIIIPVIVAGTFLFSSCGAGSAEQGSLEQKKTELAKLKAQEVKLTGDIQKLEADIVKLDPASAKKEKEKLVTLAPVASGPFTHYIDLQGKIDAQNISFVTPRNGTGGQVREVFVKKGDKVRKGQLLLKLDDALIKRQIDQLQPQLDNATSLYQRQKNLWDQGIGTEVQVMNNKTQMESQQKQMETLKEQLSYSNVYADISGVADVVNIRVGEFFTGNNQIKIVNVSDLKAVVQVPESYQQNVKVGTPIDITLPESGNKLLKTKVYKAGSEIDATSRSFWVEVKMPVENDIRPNQIALAKIQDYSVPNAITIPLNTVQNDEKGKFVLVGVNGKDGMKAVKKQVEIGKLYGDKIEITKGLQPGDQLITDGFQSLYDGQAITTKS